MDASAVVGLVNAMLPEVGPLPQAARGVGLQIGPAAFALDEGLARLVPAGSAQVECTVVFKSAAECHAMIRGELTPAAAAARGAVAVRGNVAALLGLRPFLKSVAGRLAAAGGGPAWLPDSASAACMACGASFGLARRRHHCRGCGRLFCGRCSPRRPVGGGPAPRGGGACCAGSSRLGERQCEACWQSASGAPPGLAPQADAEPGEEAGLAEKVGLLERRLEEVEVSSARKEADAYRSSYALVLTSVSLLVLSAFAARCGPAAAAAVAFAWALACYWAWLPWRGGKALWITLLVLWKQRQSNQEAKHLCGEDADKLLRRRYRMMAHLAACGMRELGGVWPKVGQYLSTMGDRMPDEVISELSKLRDAMPVAPFAEVAKTIREDLCKDVLDVFRTFDERPIASASIAQVHKAVLKDGRPVAVKVQHRHAASRIPKDLFCMRVIAHVVRILTWGDVDAMPIVSEWLGAVIEELDFCKEARNTIKARTTLMAASVKVVIPEVYSMFCSRRVMVMEFVEGVQVCAGDSELTPEDKVAVMDDLVQAYAVGMFVTGHFNADPHAGNLLVTRRGPGGQPRCVLLDWGLAKQLADDRRIALCQLMVATGMKDTCGIVQAFAGLGFKWSATAGDPEPQFLMALLRHISLIENRSRSLEIHKKLEGALEKSQETGEQLNRTIDGYTGDFFFVMRVATLIKGLCAILDIRAQFLDCFVRTGRDALRGPQLVPPPPDPPATSAREERLRSSIDAAIAEGSAVGVQVAVAAADGRMLVSLARGTVSYVSRQQLAPGDGFPLGCAWLSRAVVCAAAADALRGRGVDLSAEAASVWPKCPARAGLTVRQVLEGGPAGAGGEPEALVAAPPRSSSSTLADLGGLIKWIEAAPCLPRHAAVASWWPPICHAAACAALLSAAGAGTLQEAVRSLFVAAGSALLHGGGALVQPPSPSAASPVCISKPVMSVEGAEVEAGHDALLASVGSEALRSMHLADPCIANHPALRTSAGMPCGIAAPAAALAASLVWARRAGLVAPSLLRAQGELGCLREGPRGEVAVVLLTCASEELAGSLADAALRAP